VQFVCTASRQSVDIDIHPEISHPIGPFSVPIAGFSDAG
jgi:hypothetical protein